MHHFSVAHVDTYSNRQQISFRNAVRMVTEVSSKQSQEIQRPLMKDLFVEGTELGSLSNYYGEDNENVTKQ